MRLDKRFPFKLSAALLCLAPLLSGAPVHSAGPDGYDTDAAGNPLRAYSEECWHTCFWRPGSRFADCEPAPVVQEAAPAPVIEAPSLVTETPVRVSMDAFFEFDQATLRPEGKAALDELADRLTVTQYDKLARLKRAKGLLTVSSFKHR